MHILYSRGFWQFWLVEGEGSFRISLYTFFGFCKPKNRLARGGEKVLVTA